MELRDLSHSIETGMTVYPGDPAVTVSPAVTYEKAGFRVCSLGLGTHSGTHVDAPSHILESGAGLDQYPIEEFVFEAQILEVPAEAREPIELDLLPDSINADLLVVTTGWDQHWMTNLYRDHPYITEEVAKWCVIQDTPLSS